MLFDGYPGIDWYKMSSKSLVEHEFVMCTLENMLEQQVTFPTRGQNTLDLVFTNVRDLVYDLQAEEPLGNSDHSMVHFSVGTQVMMANKAMIPNFDKGDFNSFRSSLGKIDWCRLFDNNNAYDMWGLLKDTLHTLQNIYIPNKPTRHGSCKHKPWLTKEVRQLMKEKQQLFDKLKVTSNSEDLKNYKRCRSKVTRTIRRLRRETEHNFVLECGKNIKKMYSYHKFNSKNSRNIGPLFVDGMSIHSNNEIANALGKYFNSVYNSSSSTGMASNSAQSPNIADYVEIMKYIGMGQLHRVLNTYLLYFAGCAQWNLLRNLLQRRRSTAMKTAVSSVRVH